MLAILDPLTPFQIGAFLDAFAIPLSLGAAMFALAWVVGFIVSGLALWWVVGLLTDLVKAIFGLVIGSKGLSGGERLVLFRYLTGRK